MPAPIVLFVYNRPWHTEKTLQALMENELADQSTLYIFADGPKAGASESERGRIFETRQIIKSKKWCGKVVISESIENKGLARSIVQGVTEVVNKYGTVIVLEDDIVTSVGFLRYMNDALQQYERETQVYHIAGYMYPLRLKMPPTVFLNVVTPWGWATWQNRWTFYRDDASSLMSDLVKAPFFNQRDFNVGFGTDFYNQLEANIDGSLKTWAVKWHTSIFLQQGYCLHPGQSLVNNIGFDNSGVHCGIETQYHSDKLAEKVEVNRIPLQQSQKVLKKFHEFYLLVRGVKKPPHFLLNRMNKLKLVFLRKNDN